METRGETEGLGEGERGSHAGLGRNVPQGLARAPRLPLSPVVH
jgi:hypothetical protein